MNLDERFQAFEKDYCYFEKIENKRSQRPDIHAFLLLDEIFPNQNGDMICSASNDEIWLDVGDAPLDKLTDRQIQELVRCRVHYDDEFESLAMFV